MDIESSKLGTNDNTNELTAKNTKEGSLMSSEDFCDDSVSDSELNDDFKILDKPDEKFKHRSSNMLQNIGAQHRRK